MTGYSDGADVCDLQQCAGSRRKIAHADQDSFTAERQAAATPGQSISEEREDLLDAAFEQPLMLALFIVLLAALEWWRDFTGMKPSPIIFTLAALVTLLYAAVRIRRALPRLRALRQAFMTGQTPVVDDGAKEKGVAISRNPFHFLAPRPGLEPGGLRIDSPWGWDFLRSPDTSGSAKTLYKSTAYRP